MSEPGDWSRSPFMADALHANNLTTFRRADAHTCMRTVGCKTTLFMRWTRARMSSSIGLSTRPQWAGPSVCTGTRPKRSNT